MSHEHSPKRHEVGQIPEVSEAEARHNAEKIRERLEKEASKAEHHRDKHGERLKHKAEKTAEREAVKSEELSHRIHDANHTSAKDYNYHVPDSVPRAYTQARKQLKPIEQKFSKFIHNPKVEAISEVTGSTVARPSGLLWGSVFSFLTTSSFYIISLIFGYEYNAFVAIAAFVGGFSLGLLLEFLNRKVRHTV